MTDQRDDLLTGQVDDRYAGLDIASGGQLGANMDDAGAAAPPPVAGRAPGETAS
jgi:N-acetylmuramic acid 6-phosphate etherase